jgi:hypothetical protein
MCLQRLARTVASAADSVAVLCHLFCGGHVETEWRAWTAGSHCVAQPRGLASALVHATIVHEHHQDDICRIASTGQLTLSVPAVMDCRGPGLGVACPRLVHCALGHRQHTLEILAAWRSEQAGVALASQLLRAATLRPRQRREHAARMAVIGKGSGREVALRLCLGGPMGGVGARASAGCNCKL